MVQKFFNWVKIQKFKTNKKLLGLLIASPIFLACSMAGGNVYAVYSTNPVPVIVTSPAPPSAAYNTTFTVAAHIDQTVDTSPDDQSYALYIIASGDCSGFGNGAATITMNTGTPGAFGCTVIIQNGNGSGGGYTPGGYAVSSVYEYVTATKASQNISVTTPAQPSAANNASFTVGATADSGLTVAITASGSCTDVDNGNGTALVTMISNAGDCTILYDQAGDANYLAATEQTNVTSAQLSQSISVTTAAHGTAIYGSSFTVGATADSGLIVAITTSGVCTDVDNGDGTALVTMAGGTGTCTINYNQVGNSSYSAATQVSNSVIAQTQVLTVSGITVTDATYSGGTTAILDTSLAQINGAVAGDVISFISLPTTGTFASANAGSNIVVTIGGVTTNANPNNYSLTQPTATGNILKATPLITVTPYNVVYNAVAHSDSYSATGVVGETLSGVNVSGTTNTNAGTYIDSWTFTDVTGNYNNASGNVTNIISPATANITISGYTGVYDGNAHGASVSSATGVGGVDLSSFVNLGSMFANVPGGTANWSFANPNYVSQSGTANITITPANATITLMPYSLTYDGTAHSDSYSVIGVKGEALSGMDVTGTTNTNVGTYSDSWTFTDITGNYNNASGNVTDVISPATAMISISGFSGQYDGLTHGATVNGAVGVNGEDLSGGIVLSGGFSLLPGGVENWTFSSPNYLPQSGSVAITIYNLIAPVIAPMNDMIQVSSSPLAVYYTSPNVTDLTDPVSTASCFPASGSVFNLGSTTVTCRATNTSGISAVPVSFTVTVNPPVDASYQTLIQPLTTLTNDVSAVVVGGSTASSTIVVPSSVSNPTLDVTALLSSDSQGNITATLAGDITVSSDTSIGEVTATLPAGETITGPAGQWMGIINLPKVVTTTVTPTTDPNDTVGTATSIEIGFGNVPLTFSIPVRLLFAGQAGQLAGWSRNGQFTAITENCLSDSISGIPSGANDCFINVGSDMAIWTDHFTVFTVYTQKHKVATVASIAKTTQMKWYWWVAVVAVVGAVGSVGTYKLGYRTAEIEAMKNSRKK